MVKSVKFLCLIYVFSNHTGQVVGRREIEAAEVCHIGWLVGWLASWGLIGFYGISLDIIVDLNGTWLYFIGIDSDFTVFFMFFFF